MEWEDISSAIAVIMDKLRQQGTSPHTIKNYQNSFNVFERYLHDNQISQIDESVCLEYISFRTGIKYERFECVVTDRKTDYRMRPLLLLLRYLEDGQVHRNVRKTKPPFICPDSFRPEYEAFCEELVYRGYSKATAETNTQKVQQLITHLTMEGVIFSENITIQAIESFLKTYRGNAVKYVGVFLYVLRNYLSFLYERGYMTHDLTPMLPKLRVPRNGSIPYTWSKEDVQKLLGAIDRSDPKGKRDYAILLIAVRLGLRIGDIRNLKPASINWQKKTINLTMSKTGQRIELPLLKDIGWAIIDYLQNGRPVTTSECLFVRHRAPFNAFASYNAFNKELHRYIVKAGLNMPDDKWHGMHSLRSTLAGNMLETKAPLPIISEALGHQSINTTSIYLKIDINGLRKCAMDPEEVFAP